MLKIEPIGKRIIIGETNNGRSVFNFSKPIDFVYF